MGGKIAVEFAIRYPDWIGRLALLCPSGLAREERLPLVAGVRRSDVRTIAESVFFDSSYVDPDLLSYFQRQFQNKHWRTGLLRTVRGTMDHSVRERLCLLKQPTLVVIGDEDRIVDPGESLEAAEQLVNGRTVRLPQCGHAPQIERAELVNRLVVDFFSSNE
jgi:pimeloyl-ACP methyl ester carboxylesterase